METSVRCQIKSHGTRKARNCVSEEVGLELIDQRDHEPYHRHRMNVKTPSRGVDYFSPWARGKGVPLHGMAHVGGNKGVKVGSKYAVPRHREVEAMTGWI